MKMERQAFGDRAAAIRLADVVVSFGAYRALKGLTLTVGPGELLTVLGPSGSGKSTLLNIVSGSLSPDAGSIAFEGRDVTDLPPDKRRVGMVFQRYTLFPNKTVAENVAFPLEIRKVGREEIGRRVAEALDLVGLRREADRFPQQISGGQAQRAALARAIVFHPAILLMDEPLGALDRALRKSLQVEIRRLQQRLGIPTLYVTHDQEEAMSLSDRIVILRSGEIAAEGAPRALYETPNSVWTATFLGDANCFPLETLERRDGGYCAGIAGGLWVPVTAPRPLAEGAAASVVVRPENCRISREGATPEAFCPATVTWVEYLGAVQRVRATVGAVEVTVDIPGRSAGYAAGEAVHIGWKGADALVVDDG